MYTVFAIKIAYWDEEMNRPLLPYIADVRLQEGNITYYTADPITQALQVHLVESLPEAINKVLLNSR